MSDFGDFPEEKGQLHDGSGIIGSSKLFTNSDNEPYTFFIPIDEPRLSELLKLIDTNGGEVYNDINIEELAKGVASLNSYIPITSDVSYINEDLRLLLQKIYKPSFVFDSVLNNSLENLLNHVLDPPEGSTKFQIKRQSNRKYFTLEEDAYIIATARRNPLLCDSGTFFDYLQSQIGNHTSASIRARFRTKLKPLIGSKFYKTEDGNKLVRDENGNLILETEEIHESSRRKAQFTPDEDYILSEYISKLQRDPIPDRPGQFIYKVTTPSLYTVLAQKYPSHTYNSWRDRGRKYAIPDLKFEKYLEYYEWSKRMGHAHIKNLSSFDTTEHLDGTKNDYEATKEEFELVTSRLAEADGTLPPFEPPGVETMKSKSSNFTGKVNLELNVDVIPDEEMEAEKTLVASVLDLDPEGTTKKRATSADVVVPTKRTKSNTAKTVKVERRGNGSSDEEDDEFTDAIDSIHQAQEPILVDGDLIDHDLLKHNTRAQYMEKVRSITADCKEMEDLYEVLQDKLGISPTLTTEIVTAVSGDLTALVKYIEYYVTTGDRKPKGISGIWTSEQDKILLEGKDKLLLAEILELHGKKKLKYRKKLLQDLEKGK